MTALPRLAPGQTADIGFLLEGTYPYVSGGVSTWVHEIISGLPDLNFAVIFLGSAPEHYGEIRYKLPPNLVHLETHYLMHGASMPPPKAVRGDARAFAQMEKLHEGFRNRGKPLPSELASHALSSFGRPGTGITSSDFFYSEESWNRVRESYEAYCTDPSFVDYFWTVRSMHAPLFTLATIADAAPPMRVAHAVSTGYAGFLGALLEHRRGCPFVLTEHGIYTKERRIDLAHAGWIKDTHEELVGGLNEEGSHIRSLWIRFFEGLGRMAYTAANPIVSLYEGNRQHQIADGADPSRTAIVPNGIDLDRFGPLIEQRTVEIPPVIGLLGRVVPIKDIRSFIRTMRIVCNKRPDVEGWVVGPDDEDVTYARECRALAASLGLADKVKFLGFRRPEEILPKLGLLMLTSISEALPLVVLESFASGVPVVVTDVGSCRALVMGHGDEDRALGAAGVVTPIANPDATARAAVALLGDREAWRAAQRAGRERVRRHYTRPQMYASYRQIYNTALEVSRGRDRLRTP